MQYFKFLIQGIRRPRTVGAIAPSSKRLARQMIKDIDFDRAVCIVEYGPGTGVFTEKLIKKKKPETILLVIEKNTVFYNDLQKKYQGIANLILVNGSAENVETYLQQHNVAQADYVVSGLPFTSLPKNISDQILEKTRQILKNQGLFITFQYTLLKKAYIASFFTKIDLDRVILNLPPAYVFKCRH
ncbi:rRNA adenine N-6-methyltransferase family protein [Eubacteriaceae bacterium ES2]|nr:rRNA adenine N-6-methyltransferase family protein [Eubacteriaceae bacterium ES2]